MKLRQVRVRNFRNIIDSTAVSIDDDVTCLVGKNESGKTAFLEAICWLNPARQEVAASVRDHYPAWLEKAHRREGQDLEEVRLVEATFELDDEEQESLAERFGPGALKSTEVTVSRNYGGGRLFGFQTNPTPAVDRILDGLELEEDYADQAQALSSVEELDEYIEDLREGEEEDQGVAKRLSEARDEVLEGADDFPRAVMSALEEMLPKFFYFGEYSTLPDSVRIRELIQADAASLDADEKTARALLRLAEVDEDFLLNPDYERRKRELENAANALTADVLEYWTQNPELRVSIDITQKTESAQQGGKQAVVDEMKVRIWDDRHSLSLPFREKSTGFQWFFSFLAAFSEFEMTDDHVIILLDEPALGLHARAQADFLSFIEERLARESQVLFTTHSPFMVQPDHLERVRLVEDKGKDTGAQVVEDVLSIDPDTLFPLQGALGYDMAQNLFIAPNNLVVEGTSDFTYLSVLSAHLMDDDREGLDDDWSIVPVGGADLIPTFVALLGEHLDVTILIDGQRADHQKLGRLADDGYLQDKRIIPVAEVVGMKDANIEDVFTPEDYLTLYNRAFGEDVSPDDLTGDDSIVSQLERHLDIERFDHGRPADELLRHRDEILPNLSEETLAAFETLCQSINETLGER